MWNRKIGLKKYIKNARINIFNTRFPEHPPRGMNRLSVRELADYPAVLTGSLA